MDSENCHFASFVSLSPSNGMLFPVAPNDAQTANPAIVVKIAQSRIGFVYLIRQGAVMNFRKEEGSNIRRRYKTFDIENRVS